LFNTMRGGVFADGYACAGPDVAAFVRERNRAVFERHRALLDALPERIDHADLLTRLREPGDAHLERLGLEYLPLSFGRRHGDPSRPWNAFSIRVRDEHGARVLDYQGNWR